MIRRWICALLCLCMLMGCLPISAEEAASEEIADNAVKYAQPPKVDESNPYYIYVSPTGRSNGNGSFENPVGSIAAAAEKSKSVPKDGTYSCIKIVLRGGTYLIEDTITLTADNSGTKETPVIYTAYEGETPILTGSKEVDLSQAHKVTDNNILKQLPRESRDKVYAVDLGAQGIYGTGEFDVFYYTLKNYRPLARLIWNETDMVNARWPNEGYDTVKKVYYPGQPYYAGVGTAASTPFQNPDDPGMIFSGNSPRVETWADAKDAVLDGYWKYGWARDMLLIKGVQEDMIFTTWTPGWSTQPGGMYYVFNLLQEMDVPGEWYCDKDTEILYFYPLTEITEDTTLNIATNQSTMFTLENCNWTTFENLTFRYHLGGCFNTAGSDYVQINGCYFTGIQDIAVTFSDCDYSGILSCDLYNMGSTCISFDCTSYQELIPRNCYATNNRIEKFAQYNNTYNPAISLSYSCGIYIGHNEIFDGPCQALSCGPFKNVIEFNEIYDVCKTAADMGFLYTYWLWIAADNHFRYNYLHDGNGTGLNGHVVAVYLDQMVSGFNVYGNIIDNVQTALLTNGGRRNIFRNNMILNTPTEYRPQTLYGHAYWDVWGDWDKPDKVGFRSLFPHQSEVYQKQYPELYHECDPGEPYKPRNVYIDTNVIYNGFYIQFDDAFWEYMTFEDNQIYEKDVDLGFVDYENGDLRLKEDSIVYKDLPNFNPIPFEQIGLYIDEYRIAIEE